MTVPKRRLSKMKGRKRRTHYVASTPTVTYCPSCMDPIRPHMVCPNCGDYRKRHYTTKVEKETS